MISRRVRQAVLASGLGAAVVFAGPALAADPLPAFNVAQAATSVSGLSSGAYMAGQFHVAYSDTVVGAGIVAGGPYGCAEGQVLVALNRCMATNLGVPNAAQLVQRAHTAAAEGGIAPLSGLAADRVYFFSGTQDATVTPPVVAQAAEFYRQAGVPDAAIKVVDQVAAGHAFVTEDQGNPCPTTGEPWINDCDYDQAGDLLGHILGPLNPPAATLSGIMISFDQAEFLPNPTAHGMAETGFAYVPADCADGQLCRVHVAFHGCRQTLGLVGDAFLTMTGYNRWADTNDLIVLYPHAQESPGNPRSCWDWWGYDDPNHAVRSGRQMAAVRAMLTRLAGASEPPGAFCEVFQALNAVHWQAGRARPCHFWFLCAVGSDDNLGFALSNSVLYESPPGRFSTTSCTR